MTEKFSFGEHPSCVAAMRHTMSGLKDGGAKVTVETTFECKQKFVLHTVVADFPKKANPIVFTRFTTPR